MWHLINFEGLYKRKLMVVYIINHLQNDCLSNILNWITFSACHFGQDLTKTLKTASLVLFYEHLQYEVPNDYPFVKQNLSFPHKPIFGVEVKLKSVYKIGYTFPNTITQSIARHSEKLKKKCLTLFCTFICKIVSFIKWRVYLMFLIFYFIFSSWVIPGVFKTVKIYILRVSWNILAKYFKV